MSQSTPVENPLKQLRLLYVEDEEIVREYASEYLQRRVQKLDVACNGEDGLEKFRQNHPDLVITDIRMPKMNGLEMARQIKEVSPETPILILSAHSEVDDLVQAIEIGIDNFLFKPLKTDQFLKTLQNIAEHIVNRRLAIENTQMLEEYRHLIDVSAIVVKIDMDGNMIYVNDEFCRISGYSKEELIGKRYCNLWHEHGSEILHEEIKQRIMQHEIWKGTLHSCRKDGSEFYTDMTVVPIIDTEGNVSESIVMQYDITELIEARKTLEMEKEKLERLATIDNLTEVYNRHKFYQLAEYEIGKTRRYSRPLSLIMFDIDNFKQINDTYGHDVGDYILSTLAKIITGHLRKTDVLARWGGEEFVVMCPETDMTNTTNLAERLREAVANYAFNFVPQVTCSFGVGKFENENNIDELIKVADDKLYQAKRQGKNKVIA